MFTTPDTPPDAPSEAGSSAETSSGLIKSCSVWFPSGDIILRGDNTLFRVSKELLSRHSPIFMDMFELPSPEITNEDDSYDGCPVILMFDPADHLEHFLRGLHDPSYSITVNSNQSLRLAVGVLELSTKYETSELRERTIGSLAVIYPATIEGYRARWVNWTTDLKESFRPENISLVANIARDTNALALLPAALFHYLESYGRSVSEIIDAHDAGFALGPEKYEGDLPLLAKDNLSSILKARSRIIFSVRKNAYGFAFHRVEVDTCTPGKAGPCQQSKDYWVRHIDSQSDDGWFSPLGQNIKTLKMCAGCMPGATEHYERGLKVLWDSLPGMFDLVDWPRLERTSRLV